VAFLRGTFWTAIIVGGISKQGQELGGIEWSVLVVFFGGLIYVSPLIDYAVKYAAPIHLGTMKEKQNIEKGQVLDVLIYHIYILLYGLVIGAVIGALYLQLHTSLRIATECSLS
jgi:hypothetical protein